MIERWCVCLMSYALRCANAQEEYIVDKETRVIMYEETRLSILLTKIRNVKVQA